MLSHNTFIKRQPAITGIRLAAVNNLSAGFAADKVAADMNAVTLKVDIVPCQCTDFPNPAAGRKHQTEQHLIHIVLAVGIKRREECLDLTIAALPRYAVLIIAYYGEKCNGYSYMKGLFSLYDLISEPGTARL